MNRFKIDDRLKIVKKPTRNSLSVGDIVKVINTDNSSCPYQVTLITGYMHHGYEGWVEEEDVELAVDKNIKKIAKKGMKTAFILKNQGGELAVFETKQDLIEYVDGNDCEEYTVFEVEVTKTFKVDDIPRLVEVKKPAVKKSKKTAKQSKNK